MLDPEQHTAAAAAAAATSRPGASSSSSSEATFSDGLVQDSVSMLQMLHDANALAQGPARLALQVYSHKAAGCLLPLPHKNGGQLRAEDLVKVLDGFPRSAQLEIRSFLLQVGVFAHHKPFVLLLVQLLCPCFCDWGFSHRLAATVQKCGRAW